MAIVKAKIDHFLDKNMDYKIRCYFDANATTIMPKSVIDEIVRWTNMGNSSSDYCSAVRCRKMIQNFREYVANLCKFKLCIDGTSPATPQSYRVVFTSGASESNALIIRSVIDSYLHNVEVVPHIVTSQIEHKAVLNTIDQLVEEGRCTATFIPPNPLGFISVNDVTNALTANTALCTIMAANNETGVMNDYSTIAKICHTRGVPFHTDAVQLFGKKVIQPNRDHIDAFSISAHKLHGPTGVGMLIMKEDFIRGYKLKGQIGGTQNAEFRGGTMNISGIAGSFEAIRVTMDNRINKNTNLRNMKRLLIAGLSKKVPCMMYREYLRSKGVTKATKTIVFLSTAEEHYLPHTLLLSIVKSTKPDMCNAKLKRHLESKGIIVSIGSACNTDNKKASHVLTAMQATPIIKRGTIRISFDDTVTENQINICIDELAEYVEKLT